jgi:NCAIR mutase (PurE)-related protein
MKKILKKSGATARPPHRLDTAGLEALLASVAGGSMTPREAAERLASLPFVDLGHTKLDTHRQLRQGYPEVVFGAGKTIGQITEIARAAIGAGHAVLVTRVERDAGKKLEKALKPGRYDETSKTFRHLSGERAEPRGQVAVVTAGTSDIPIAEEAAVTLEVMGHAVDRIYDVGVAGIHRLFSHMERLRKANAVVVVAGMEGALASVVGGLVRAPVIAVPAGIGYGASFGGVAALLGMLNSCSSNVSVVNIGNGFGAATVAGLVNDLATGKARRE